MPPWPRKRPRRVRVTEEVDHQGPSYVPGSTATFVRAGQQLGQPVTKAEENVAGGLHQALPNDNALAVVGIPALADEPFQHRFLGLIRRGGTAGRCRLARA